MNDEQKFNELNEKLNRIETDLQEIKSKSPGGTGCVAYILLIIILMNTCSGEFKLNSNGETGKNTNPKKSEMFAAQNFNNKKHSTINLFKKPNVR